MMESYKVFSVVLVNPNKIDSDNTNRCIRFCLLLIYWRLLVETFNHLN